MVTFNNVSSEKENGKARKRKISIIESGFNCRRGLNVNSFGMPLTKKRKYNSNQEIKWFYFSYFEKPYRKIIHNLYNVYVR